MDWYWCIAQRHSGSKIEASRFQAESHEDAFAKATEWWKTSGGLKSEFFAVALETHLHEIKVKPRAYRERWKPKE